MFWYRKSIYSNVFRDWSKFYTRHFTYDSNLSELSYYFQCLVASCYLNILDSGLDRLIISALQMWHSLPLGISFSSQTTLNQFWLLLQDRSESQYEVSRLDGEREGRERDRAVLPPSRNELVCLRYPMWILGAMANICVLWWMSSNLQTQLSCSEASG